MCADGGVCHSAAENLAQAWGGVTMVIKTAEEIENCKRAIFDNANETHERLKEKIRLLSATEFLEELKFDRLGADPMKGTELNFIEQLNQMFSDLVVLEGARRLLCLYPEKELRLNLGPSSGFDIESIDGEIVAESSIKVDNSESKRYPLISNNRIFCLSNGKLIIVDLK